MVAQLDGSVIVTLDSPLNADYEDSSDWDGFLCEGDRPIGTANATMGSTAVTLQFDDAIVPTGDWGMDAPLVATCVAGPIAIASGTVG